MDEAQQGFGGGDVGEVVFSVSGGQFQSVTVCHRLQLAAERLMQQRLLQRVQRRELLPVEGFEALGSGMVHGAPGFALKHLVN